MVNIKKLRKQKKLSQLGLAKLAGVSRTSISNIEKGGGTDVRIYERIIFALGYEVVVILRAQE